MRTASLALAALLALACNAYADKLELEKKGSFKKMKVIELGNFVRVDVEGDGSFHYKGFNVRTGNAFRPPYDEFLVKTKSGKFLITDKGVGNGKVLINKKLFKVGIKQHLVITASGKIKIAAGGSSGIPKPVQQ